MFDWQLLTVALIIGGSALFVGARTWNRIRSFNAGVEKSRGTSGCTGCGMNASGQECGRNEKQVPYQIGR